jgi:miniconductance mechanosensitive channel
MRETVEQWLRLAGLKESAIEASTTLVLLCAVLALAWVVDFVVRKILLRFAAALAKRTRSKWDDKLLENRAFHRGAHIVGALVVYALAPAVFANFPKLNAIFRNVLEAYVVLVTLLTITGALRAFLDVYQAKHPESRVPMRVLVQATNIAMWFIGLIIIIALLIDQSPAVLLGGLGAMTAVLAIVYKDSLLGFVAGIQIASNDLLRKGDWIEMPDYNADGDVTQIGLTTIKVQNWDKTITSIPSYAIITASFKNWRGMSESGGRRIKRAIQIDMNSVEFCTQDMIDRFQIDMNSVEFCTQDMIDRFRRIDDLKDYIDGKQTELQDWNAKRKIDDSVLVNGRRMTNLGTFRAYLVSYLRNHPMINQDMTFLVRQLPPTAEGLPIEIYVFSGDKRWAAYEDIQSDIFDHILAVIPEFDLRVYQHPSGKDVQEIASLGQGLGAARQ